jgi:mevalonate kinase
MNSVFHTRSNGKLLLTGEYMVLRGAIALALPLVKGQQLEVRIGNGSDRKLRWTSTFMGERFLEAEFDLQTLSVCNSSDPEIAAVLTSIFSTVRGLNPEFLMNFTACEADSTADFHPGWGLGSSSTLIANIAAWAGVNPYHLNQLIFNGSGYDIACALSEKSIQYQLVNQQPISLPVIFSPPFSNKLFFAYLGRKQDTRAGVAGLVDRIEKATNDLIDRISEVSKALPGTVVLNDFISLLKVHDNELSTLLGIEPLYRGRFKNFPGYVKSLGAWGGDFILVCWQGNEPTPHAILNKLGIELVFPYNELVRL